MNHRVPRWTSRPALWLAIVAAAGVASVALYVVAFARPYSLTDWWQYALVDYGTISGYTLEAQVAFVAAFLVLFALNYAAFGALTRWSLARPSLPPPLTTAGEPSPPSGVAAVASSLGPLALILAVQLAAGLALVATYPIGALDVFDYVLYARLALYWHANPLVQVPSMFPAEPTLGFSYWPNEPSIYGPLWQALSERVIGVVDGQVLEGLIAFKLLALGAALATTVVLWLTLRRVRPAFAVPGAVLWAWNPLVLFETAGNAHNDALMVACLALAWLVLVRGPRVLALPLVAAGLLIKITLAPLVPVVAVALLLASRPVADRAACGAQDSLLPRAARLGASVLLSLALVVVAYAPYWQGRASLPFLDRGNWFTASPPTLLREAFRGSLDLDAAGQRAAIVCALAFALVSAAILLRLLRRGLNTAAEPGEVARAAYHVFFAYLVVACLWWQPWYLLVLLVVAILAADRRLVDRANLFAVGGVLSYVVFKYIWQIHQQDWQLDYGKIMAISVVAIFTLPLGHLAWHALRVPRPHRARRPEPTRAAARTA